MNWETKARIQRLCARVPRGATLYARIQKRFGNLAADPFKRIPHHIDMMRSFRDLGFDVEGARCLEVGTGHIPTLPLMFSLCGAREVVTIDLRPRVQWAMVRDTMQQLAGSADVLASQYEGLVDTGALRSRVDEMATYVDDPKAYFERAGIQYIAPGDASHVDAPDCSFDLHFSTTVLEHVELEALTRILLEAKRLLHPEGIAWHRIDPSDHFAHNDAQISLVNFLKFSDADWSRIAGNEFGFCNRLRASEFLAEFRKAGFTIRHEATEVDSRALDEIKGGTKVDQRFASFTPDDLATVQLDVAAQP